MSARTSALGVQNCLTAAVVSLVESMGTARAAGEIGCDPSTIRRKKADGGWDVSEIAALIAYEMQEKGRSSILVALARLHNDSADRVGEPVRLRGEMLLELKESAEVDQAILANIDRSTAEGRRTIRDRIATRRAHEDEFLNDLDAVDRVNS